MSSIPPSSSLEATEVTSGPGTGSPAAVETLAYGGAGAGGGNPWRVVARAVGLATVVAGGMLAVSDALQLLGWIGGWSDPYMFRINQPGGVGGIPPSPALVAVSVARLAYGSLWVFGGAVCLRRGGRWARWVLVGGAVLAVLVEIGHSTMWLIYNTLMPIGRGGGATFSAVVFDVAPRMGWLAVVLGFPGLLIAIGGRRELWQ